MTLAHRPLDELPALLTYDEAADYLRRCTRTVRRYVAAGRLRAVQADGTSPLIDRESVRAFVRGE